VSQYNAGYVLVIYPQLRKWLRAAARLALSFAGFIPMQFPVLRAGNKLQKP
jgi:hypothetical protein